MLWMISDISRTPMVAATVESVAQVAMAGAAIVTLRGAGVLSDDEIAAAVGEIKEQAPDSVLLVRGDIRFARRCGADGIHLPSSALGKIAAIRREARGLRLAVSTHAPREFERAFADGADLALYGPVFPPRSKPDDTRPTVAPVKREGLFLIGGIDRGRAESLIHKGFWDLAAVSLFYGQTATDDVQYLSRLMNEEPS